MVENVAWNGRMFLRNELMRIAAINKCDFVKIKWRRTNNYLYTERSMSKYDDTTTYKAKLLSMDSDAVRIRTNGVYGQHMHNGEQWIGTT